MARHRLFRGLALLAATSLFVTACSATAPTIAPATQAPVTQAPVVTAAPATPVAVTPAPVTPAPVTPAPVVTPVPVTPAPVTPEPATPAPTSSGEFTGVNVNILTFNGPQVAEPLQRRAPDWEALTGGHVNVVAVGFNVLYQQALLDASTGTNSFDAYVFDPQWMGDFTGPGYLLDLSDRVTNDPTLNWNDVGPFFRDFNATYNSKVYTIPLDGDFHMVYYRKDILERDGVTPPATWQDYLTVAEKYQGQDLNEDGKPDYGSCIAKAPKQQSYWWIISVAAGLLQAKGTSEGGFFNTTDGTPLFGPNEAMKLALETYNKTKDFGPPDEINLGVGDTRGLFTSGRCALSMDWGDIGTLQIGTYANDKTGATITPGWKQILDRSTGKLVDCDATTCPNAVNGVNYAPFASFGGWSGALNAHTVNPPADDASKAAVKKQQDAAYAFLAYMSSPAISGVDVTLGKTGYNPYRTSHFENLGPWVAAGLSEAAATNYLGAIKSSLQSPNMLLDLRIPLTQRYQQVVLDQAVSQYTAGEIDVDTAMQQIADGWNAISDEATGGKEAQLAAYVASLGVQR
jgi:multiple sugar transport system substrate-binding protein